MIATDDVGGVLAEPGDAVQAVMLAPTARSSAAPTRLLG